MERSCKVQLLADRTGLEKMIVSDEEAAYNYKMASTPVCYFFSAVEDMFLLIRHIGDIICGVSTTLPI